MTTIDFKQLRHVDALNRLAVAGYIRHIENEELRHVIPRLVACLVLLYCRDADVDCAEGFKNASSPIVISDDKRTVTLGRCTSCLTRRAFCAKWLALRVHQVALWRFRCNSDGVVWINLGFGFLVKHEDARGAKSIREDCGEEGWMTRRKTDAHLQFKVGDEIEVELNTKTGIFVYGLLGYPGAASRFVLDKLQRDRDTRSTKCKLVLRLGEQTSLTLSHFKCRFESK